MKIQNNSDIKYQFSVVTWGGFYNEEYKRIHGYEEGKKVFDSKQEREEYINKLQLTETELSAHHLAMTFDEGFTVNTSVTLHRVIKLKDKFYYSKNEVNVWSNFEGNFATASYQMENKWYPGFNDYPAGEDVNYDEAEIVQEWITGAFKPE